MLSIIYFDVTIAKKVENKMIEIKFITNYIIDENIISFFVNPNILKTKF